ncbi:MAG: hypothetical protein RL120_14255 [Gammaproteobacteria bacterium]
MKIYAYLLLQSVLITAPAFGAASPIIFNGGITMEERAGAPTEGIRLVFFVAAGNFLSDIDVSVSNEAGRELVNVTTEGPWLILDLDPGNYRVVATRGNGQVQSLIIRVDESSQEFGFSFPDEL